MFALEDLPSITDIRGYGLLAGFDLAPAEAPGARGADVMKRLYDAGIYIKFTGDTGLVAPPLIAGEKDVDAIRETLREVIGPN